MCSRGFFELLTVKEVCHGWRLRDSEVMARLWMGELEARDTYEEFYLITRSSVERVFGPQKRKLVTVILG